MIPSPRSDVGKVQADAGKVPGSIEIKVRDLIGAQVGSLCREYLQSWTKEREAARRKGILDELGIVLAGYLTADKQLAVELRSALKVAKDGSWFIDDVRGPSIKAGRKRTRQLIPGIGRIELDVEVTGTGVTIDNSRNPPCATCDVHVTLDLRWPDGSRTAYGTRDLLEVQIPRRGTSMWPGSGKGRLHRD
jgi:hypothetical protein